MKNTIVKLTIIEGAVNKTGLSKNRFLQEAINETRVDKQRRGKTNETKSFILKKTILPNGSKKRCFTESALLPGAIPEMGHPPIAKLAASLVELAMAKMACGPESRVGREMGESAVVIRILAGLALFKRKIFELALVSETMVQLATIKLPLGKGRIESSPGRQIATKSLKIADFPINYRFTG